MSAIDDISAERARQVSKEGWTAEHDDEHADGSLAVAGACYALSDHPLKIKDPRDRLGRATISINQMEIWPWDFQWWKPSNNRRNLVKAAALIVAEIERLDRSKASALPNGERK